MAIFSYLQVNRVCNQRCLFCSNPESGKVLGLEDAKRSIDRFAAEGVAGVIITGGEPTLYEPLLDLISYAREKKLPARLTTNGQITADYGYLAALKAAGLDLLFLSVHSHLEETQSYLTGNPDSLKNIVATLNNAEKIGLRVDINITICKQNSKHLHKTVKWLCGNFEFIRHFSWTNLDPFMNRVAENRHVVPVLAEIEKPLLDAMQYLDGSGRTFRVEKVPLCYMAEFAHCSTETRRIVKDELFIADYLDYRESLKIKKHLNYNKTDICRRCSFDGICAGLFEMGAYYDPDELKALDADPRPVIDRILGEKN